jgi:hypothetical protein
MWSPPKFTSAWPPGERGDRRQTGQLDPGLLSGGHSEGGVLLTGVALVVCVRWGIRPKGAPGTSAIQGDGMRSAQARGVVGWRELALRGMIPIPAGAGKPQIPR